MSLIKPTEITILDLREGDTLVVEYVVPFDEPGYTCLRKAVLQLLYDANQCSTSRGPKILCNIISHGNDLEPKGFPAEERPFRVELCRPQRDGHDVGPWRGSAVEIHTRHADPLPARVTTVISDRNVVLGRIRSGA